MKHDCEFWTRHVEAWHAGELTQREYCRRHRLTKGTFGYWASKLRRETAGGTQLVEVGRTEAKPRQPGLAIELAVDGRYLLRLWPGVDAAHLREVLSVLECRP